MTKITKYVSGDLYLNGDTIREAIDTLQGLLDDGTPETATICVGGNDDGGFIDISYTRLETDEEYEHRLRLSKEMEERRNKSEFETYMKLKKKFDVSLDDML